MADQIVSWGGFDSKGTDGMGITGSLSVDGSTFISSSNATQLQVGNNSLFVSGSGDIGVGTTTPSYKLDVSGSGNFTDNLTVTGSLTVSGSDIFIQNNQFYSSYNATGTAVGLLRLTPSNNTQLRAQSGNNIAFETDGQNAMWIGNDQRVGIGTISPSAKLQVQGSGTTSATTALRVENSAGTARLTILDDGTSAFNTNALYVSGSGRVGLGTTAPTQLLDVRGRIIVTKTSSLGPQHGISSDTTLEVYANGTPAELMIHEDSGSSVASLYFRRGGEDQRIIANERGLEFNLEGGGGTTTMTLEHQTHNVAIGQQSPTARLHVKGSGTTSATTALLVENSSAQAALTIKDDKTATFGGDIFTANGSTLSGSFGSSGGDYIRIHGLNYGGQAKFASYDYGTYRTAEIAFGSGDIHWRGLYKLSTNGYYLTDSVGSLGLFERFTVDYLGRVGISNPNPSYRLDVSGSGNFTNNLTVTGSATISNILTLIPQDPLPVRITNRFICCIFICTSQTLFL
jgi:hypothetical protein